MVIIITMIIHTFLSRRKVVTSDMVSPIAAGVGTQPSHGFMSGGRGRGKGRFMSAVQWVGLSALS